MPPLEEQCICREELGYWNNEHIYVHLSWCPSSYFYKRAVEEYIAAPFWKKWFMTDPRKYHNFLWTPPY
jgi:hypothetical protein